VTGLTVLRYLDLALLALALPAFLIAGWPLGGWAAAGSAWLISRWIQVYATKKAVETGDRRAAMGVMAGTLVGRIWLMGLAVLAAGLVEREAGLAAGLLAAGLFTTYFVTLLIVKPIEEARVR
jgi:hypothetical protein